MHDAAIWSFTEQDKQLIRSLVAKGRAEQAKNEQFAVIDFDSLYALLADDEIGVIKKWLAMDAQQMSYKLPFLGAQSTVETMVPIKGQARSVDGRSRTVPCQYLPRHVYDAYQRLGDAMQADLGKKVLVLFGYRSPARQAFIFFDILHTAYDFDFGKTIRRVCLPDYSEHVCSQRQAIDFARQQVKADEKFENTDEYRWLKQNAQRYGFAESYPADNDLGMMYEPWHWHYEAAT